MQIEHLYEIEIEELYPDLDEPVECAICHSMVPGYEIYSFKGVCIHCQAMVDYHD